MTLCLSPPFRLSGTTCKIAVACIFAASAPASAAVIAVTDQGLLTGARNVDLGALGLYSVKFAKGSCNAVFDNQCDVSSFAFNTAADSTLAANALLEQVLVGRYDDLPRATYGCWQDLSCTIYTPFGVNIVRSQSGYSDASGSYAYVSETKYVRVSAATNYAKYFNWSGYIAEGYPDTVGVWSGPELSYGGYLDMYVPHFALWRRQDAPVTIAEPGAASLAALGLVLVGLSRRRKRSASSAEK